MYINIIKKCSYNIVFSLLSVLTVYNLIGISLKYFSEKKLDVCD